MEEFPKVLIDCFALLATRSAGADLKSKKIIILNQTPTFIESVSIPEEIKEYFLSRENIPSKYLFPENTPTSAKDTL
jgi:hypothetical protein